MTKALAHFGISILIFLGIWFGLSKIDFLERTHLQELGKENEKQLGKMIIESLKEIRREVSSEEVKAVLDSVKERICVANHLNGNEIQIYLFVGDEINAFSLPNNTIMVYTGLIKSCENPEELAGVLAHEIAHIEKHHISKKLSKEVGFAVLMTISNSKVGSQILKQIIRMLSSTGFDRAMEHEADVTAVDYLISAEIDPENFANFMFRLSQEKSDVPSSLEWLSTHPNSKERTAEILSLRNKRAFKTQPMMTDSSWNYFKKEVSEK